jgi:hypothetical protein
MTNHDEFWEMVMEANAVMFYTDWKNCIELYRIPVNGQWN